MENEKTIINTCLDSSKVIKGKWSKIFGGCVLTYGSLILLMLFPVFGFALAFFAMGFLGLGLNTYILNILQNREVKAEEIFGRYKEAIPAFCLYSLKMFYCLLWSLLLIVPGIIMATNYGFSKYIMSDKQCDAFTALYESKSLSYGYRVRMFLLYLMYLLLFVVVASAGAGIAILINYFSAIPIYLMIIITLLFALPIFLAFILPFAEVSFASLYLEAKSNKVKKDKPKQTKKTTSSKVKTSSKQNI